MQVERGAQLRQGGVARLLLADACAHAHHLGKRPVGDALAVGEAAAAVPPDLVDQAVDVLLELPRETRLADPRDPDDGDEMRLALFGARVEELLDEPQLPVASDERRLEALRLQRAGA